MCGIAGILASPAGFMEAASLPKMIYSLTHRGPDEEGSYQDHNVALGIRRLSIIDKKNGQQPLSSPDGRYVLVFNGEIYNYLDVKKTLINKGASFKTDSDTEVFLQTILAWGLEGITRLNGMFAAALWDKKKGELILIRDRLGVKPLYYTQLENGTLLFASEMKALLAHKSFKSNLNVDALFNLFRFGFQLCPQTFLKDVHHVLPGHYLSISKTKMEHFCYWDLEKKNYGLNSERDSIDYFRSLLEDSVRIRLVGEREVASYLSGGLDSSIVTSLYSQMSGNKISSFSIGFNESSYDERKFSQIVSEKLDINHHSFLWTEEKKDLSEFSWFLEDPLVTLLQLPLLALSSKVSQSGFSVVLTGDGADELFGGYDYFKMMKIFQFIQRDEKSSYRLDILERLNPILKSKEDKWSFYQYMKYQYYQNPGSCQNLPYCFQLSQDFRQLFSSGFLEQYSDSSELLLWFDPQKVKNLSSMDQMFYLEQKFRLLNMTLPLSDKLSMANSVENRSPFLDYRIAEFAYSLPSHWKVQGLNEKQFLKKSYTDLLPGEIVSRRKQPLLAPIEAVKKSYETELADLSSESMYKQYDIFNFEYIQSLKKNTQNLESSKNVSSLEVIISLIHLWHQLFIDKKQRIAYLQN